jgi:hypothetical protein
MTSDAIDWIAAAILLIYAVSLLVLARAIHTAEEPDEHEVGGIGATHDAATGTRGAK